MTVRELILALIEQPLDNQVVRTRYDFVRADDPDFEDYAEAVPADPELVYVERAYPLSGINRPDLTYIL